MHTFEILFGNWVVRKRWWIIVASLVLGLAAASGGRLLSFVNDSRVFFSEENPQLQALEALENTYVKNENVFFILAPKDGDVFTRKTLTAVEELTEAAWQIPYSSRVNSLSNFQHTRSENDDLIVEDLVLDAQSLSDSELEEIKYIALNEPLLVNRQVSDRGHVTGINVNILKPGESQGEVREVADFVRVLADDFRVKYPGLDIYLSGGIIIDHAFGEASLRDLTTLVPAMYLVLIVIMGLTLRSVAGTFVTFLVIAFSMFTGLGLAGWLGIALTPASANAPTIILTLAVADSIHVLITIFYQMRAGRSKHEAIAESLRINLQPVFLTSITTTIGFLSMNFSDAPPFRDLGNVVAMGVIAAFFYSIFFLPALMAVLPIREKKQAEQREFRMIGQFADYVIRRRAGLFWVMLLVFIPLASGISQIELNDNFVKYFDESYDFRRATDFAEDNLTGFDVIEYSLESGEPGGINNPNYLLKVDEFANWYKAQPNVVHVISITEVMKRLNKNMHGDDPAFYRIPESRELAAQNMLLYEMSLPFGLDLNNQINVDKSATRMIVTLKKVTAADLRELDENARDWLSLNAPESMFSYGSGLSIMFAHISKRNIESMLGASIFALILISAILIVALRSFKLGFVSLLPNLSPAILAFGIWGLAVGEVGLAVSVMIAMTLGIVVDDTVHFISKYQRARREEQMSSPDAVRYAFETVGSALFITTLILAAGFTILSFSGFKVNSDMGQMTVITIVMALLMDFFFLPIVLMKVDKSVDKRSVTQ
ncbi:MAG: MMPL family transporter [Desulfobulbaceae bacterium]|uniref:MMPL family transporter n=1 Tax=Candidatus Desulfatifera sulfidica TaxID=2841691 RepID=A0A8J6T9K4_9BACT|nr:MMPL family transporter [Candidatus Desulfatifera sulfidica]